MNQFSIERTQDYLKEINQNAREPERYYTSIVDKIANYLKTCSEPASSIVLCPETADGKNWFNDIFNEDGKPIFPLMKYIVVNFSAGYWVRKDCLGPIIITKELHDILLRAGWKKSHFPYDISYELSLE